MTGLHERDVDWSVMVPPIDWQEPPLPVIVESGGIWMRTEVADTETTFSWKAGTPPAVNVAWTGETKFVPVTVTMAPVAAGITEGEALEAAGQL